MLILSLGIKVGLNDIGSIKNHVGRCVQRCEKQNSAKLLTTLQIWEQCNLCSAVQFQTSLIKTRRALFIIQPEELQHCETQAIVTGPTGGL